MRLLAPRRPRWAVVVLAALLVLTGCSFAQGDGEPEHAERDHTAYLRGAYAAPAGVLLAPPVTEPATNRTFRKLLANIAHTPPGARIRIAARSFSFDPAAEALVAAAERGVKVQVIVDRSVAGDWSTVEKLREALGTDRRKDSFLHLFRGLLHEKWWSFTRTGDSRDVTMVGSMNLTYYSSGQYTDMYSFVGRPDVRRAFDAEFRSLLAGDRRGSTQSTALGRDAVWFYPGYTMDSDPVYAALAAVPAAGADIRVLMYATHTARGVRLAELLVAKAAAGARVQVIIGSVLTWRPRAVLEEGGVEIIDANFGQREGIADNVHHKLTLASWPVPGGRERMILTGSDNWTTDSLDRHEVLVRIDAGSGANARAYRDYVRFADSIVRRAERKES